jgi:hypothetical protein
MAPRPAKLTTATVPWTLTGLNQEVRWQRGLKCGRLSAGIIPGAAAIYCRDNKGEYLLKDLEWADKAATTVFVVGSGSIEFVGGDLQLVTIGIVKVDGMGDVMVLESDLNALDFKLFLSSQEVRPVGAKGKVGYADVILSHPGQIRAFRGKECN